MELWFLQNQVENNKSNAAQPACTELAWLTASQQNNDQNVNEQRITFWYLCFWAEPQETLWVLPSLLHVF